MNFIALEGDSLGVYQDDNYRLVQCMSGHIVFSYAQKGKAMTAHIASDKIGLRYVKSAINGFCDWLFKQYGWCEMIFAAIDEDKQSVARIVKKCNFNYLVNDTTHTIYVRAR